MGTPMHNKKVKTKVRSKTGATKRMHSQSRKRKAEAHVRTFVFFSILDFITSELLSGAWDITKTVSENYKSIGLSSDPNADIHVIQKHPLEHILAPNVPAPEPEHADKLKGWL